ncbi:MAG TPA: metal ABC transporter substrate-binding protein [Polyangiaceae bacterium]|nr:metal ABC transporter substrate-binding protein [Polyangiaceae bacterium]
MRLSRRPFLTLPLLIGGPAACGSKSAPKQPAVAASIFPVYDLTRRVAGDRVETVLLLPPGRSEHGYDPTPAEMARVSGAKLTVEVGLGLDDWVGAMVRRAAGREVASLRLGPKASPRPITTEAVGEEAAEHGHDEHEKGERHGEHEKGERHGEHEKGERRGEHAHERGGLDPHVWLDPVRMRDATPAIVESLSTLDPEGAQGYRARGEALREALSALDAEIGARAKRWARRVIVTFHGSMGYYAERYGLKVAAVIEPFPGREPTAKYVKEVLAAIAASKPAALFSEPQLDRRPAQAIADEAKLPLFELDPVGGGPNVDSYEKLLRHDTDMLERALGA